MNLSYTLKNLANPLQVLIRPMLLTSVALHGLLLLMPMPEEKAKIPKKEKTVKVTQLALPPSKPAASTAPKTLIATKPKVTPLTSRPVQPVVRRQPLIQAVKPKLVQTPLPPRQVTATPSPSATASPAVSPNVEPTTPPSDATNTPLAEFPHFPGAKPGCLEVPSCFQTANDLAKVADHFTKELPAKGFTAPEDINEAERKVYQVSRSDFPPQYLSLISTKDGTIYVLADQPRSLDELKNAVDVPPEFYTILAEVGEELEDESQFSEPTQFYTKLSSQDSDASLIPAQLRPEIQATKLIADQTPDAVYATMLSSLQSIFEVSESGSYGGGTLYTLKKGSFSGYLNLVPTKDNSGTIVVLWTESPV